MNKGKKTLLIVAALAVVLAAAIWIALAALSKDDGDADGVTYSNIDISSIPDGAYIGEYDDGRLYAKVEVTVRGGAIERIDLLEHRHGRGEAAERITEDIIRQQKINVDAISGATGSSTAIKKAVDEALRAR